MKQKNVVRTKLFLHRMEIFLTSLFLFVIFSVFAYSSIKSIYSDFLTISTGETVIGIVKNVSKDDERNFIIEVEYKSDDETVSGKFLSKKRFTDYIGDYFSTKYRSGNKIPVIIGKDKNIVPYSERKSLIRNDVISLAGFIVLMLVFAVLMINKDVYKIDLKKYDAKEMVCSSLNLVSIICFIVVAFNFLILRRNETLSLIFLCSGYAMMFLTPIFLKKETFIKGKGTVSYDEEPGWFLIASAVHIIMSLGLGVCIIL